MATSLATLQANQREDEARLQRTKDPKQQKTILDRIQKRAVLIANASAPTSVVKPTEVVKPVNPNDVNNNGIPDNIEAAQLAADSAAALAEKQMADMLKLEELKAKEAELERAADARRIMEMEAAQALRDRKSAFDIMYTRFQGYGLGSLANEIKNIYQGTGVNRFGVAITEIPTTSEGFYLALTETKSYYERFGKVNEMRVKSGYTALDEKTILGMEDEYQKAFKDYNMPAGFYDTPEDFQNLLANNLDMIDVTDILQAGYAIAANTDQYVKDQLKSRFNIDESAIAAYATDPVKGQQVINALAGKNLSAAAALLSGISDTAAARATALGAGDLRFAEQQRGFSLAAAGAKRGEFLSAIDRNQGLYGQEQAVETVFGGLEQSKQAGQKLASAERARFRKSVNLTTGALATPTSGQY